MKNSNAKILAAFLAGAVAGASLGILFAPDKGVETRRKIREKMEDLGDKAQEQYEKLRRRLPHSDEDDE